MFLELQAGQICSFAGILKRSAMLIVDALEMNPPHFAQYKSLDRSSISAGSQDPSMIIESLFMLKLNRHG